MPHLSKYPRCARYAPGTPGHAAELESSRRGPVSRETQAKSKKSRYLSKKSGDGGLLDEEQEVALLRTARR